MIKSTCVRLNPDSTFITGFNNTGSGENELIENMPDGTQRVLLSGMTNAQVEALVLILNSPDPKD